MEDAPITRERVDELLRFLPLVSAAGPDTEPRWEGIDFDHDAFPLMTPAFTYPGAIEEFFRLAGSECWRDRDYQPAVASALLGSDGRIARASLAEVRSMLTYAVRGERFTTGHWSVLISQGRIAALLRRLQELRDELPAAAAG